MVEGHQSKPVKVVCARRRTCAPVICVRALGGEVVRGGCRAGSESSVRPAPAEERRAPQGRPSRSPCWWQARRACVSCVLRHRLDWRSVSRSFDRLTGGHEREPFLVWQSPEHSRTAQSGGRGASLCGVWCVCFMCVWVCGVVSLGGQKGGKPQQIQSAFDPIKGRRCSRRCAVVTSAARWRRSRSAVGSGWQQSISRSPATRWTTSNEQLRASRWRPRRVQQSLHCPSALWAPTGWHTLKSGPRC